MSGTKLSWNNISIIVTLIVTHWEGALSVNVLESTPSAVNGVMTVCVGEQITLTCSHDNVVTGGTRWKASLPINCLTDVSHPTATATPCGPFMFQEITPLTPIPTLLNSTAVATATVNMTGTNIECRGGNVVNSFSVGNISLFVDSVVDQGEFIASSPGSLIYVDKIREPGDEASELYSNLQNFHC